MSSYEETWNWKEEPESPTSSVLDGSDDAWLFDNSSSIQLLDDGADEHEPNRPMTSEQKTRAQVAAQLLEDLDVWVKDEPFPDWCEQKIDLNIFEGIPPLDDCSKLKQLDTVTLLQEFESVCDAVALTPPQSPPYDAGEPFEPLSLYPEPSTGKPSYTVSFVDDMILLDQQPQPEDVAMELAAVDELVRIRAEGIDASLDPWESSDASSPAGPALSPPETSNDSFGTDPEWIPETVHSPKASTPKRKRGKPYCRPVEDRKLIKKEQNKTAATRYRQKKKQELEVILDEEKGLEDKNGELKEKVTDLQREIKYLKGLMRDMFKAKGLL